MGQVPDLNVPTLAVANTCSVDVDLNCTDPGILNGTGPTYPHNWITVSPAMRITLAKSASVQNSLEGCMMFANLMYTECGFTDPLTYVYTPDINRLIANTVNTPVTDRSIFVSYGSDFQSYINNATLASGISVPLSTNAADGGTTTNCNISIPYCPGAPYGGTFSDTTSASTSAGACLALAQSYYTACGADPAVVVQVTYSGPGIVTQTAVWNYTIDTQLAFRKKVTAVLGIITNYLLSN